MKEIITQVCVSNALKFFKKGLMERWNLVDYYNENLPCLFFGIYTNEALINNHKGLKILYFSSPADTASISEIVNSDNLFIIYTPYVTIPPYFKVKNIEFELKDYSMFKPNILGDKVYAYVGHISRYSEFNYNRILNIQQKINWEILLGECLDEANIPTINECKEKYYDKCFVNLNLSHGTGLTTVRELAYMGRLTISNALMNFPCFLKYDNDEHIIELIKQEANKIGTIQPSINCHNIGDEWLCVDFWK